MSRKTAPTIASPGMRRCRRAPSCRRISTPTRTNISTCWKGNSISCLRGADAQATPGDLIRLGMGVPHGIFNKSDQTPKVLFWVSPSQQLYDLFWGIHNMKEQKPEDAVPMAPHHNVHFLPPPPAP